MRNRDLLAAAALIVVTAAAYGPAMRAGFVWDDDQHVVQDSRLGSAAGLARIWTAPGTTPQYYPLVHTSFWIENRLWGHRPFGYHLVNILIHALSAILFAGLLRRLNVPGAWLAGALFALHPVNAESVAWITERKNVLSGLFYLFAAGAYLRFAPPDRDPARPRSRPPEAAGDRRAYILALVLFACALLSKTVTATLPAALLLVLWWKRGRITGRDVLPLAPFLALGIGLSFVTVAMERGHVGARGGEWSLSAIERVLIAGRALFFYLSKLILPIRLTFIYPRWSLDPGSAAQMLLPVAAILSIVGLVLLRKRIGRGPATAALFFAGSLVPALGFFNVFPMRYSFVADHFQYLATLGPIAAAAATIDRRLPRAAGFAIVVVLAALTFHRAGAYRDPETLWRDTIAKNPSSWMAQHNLGLAYEEAGRLDEAIAQYRKAIAIRPDLDASHYSLATALAKQGKLDEARRNLEEAVRLRPDYVEAWNNLGNVLHGMGRIDEAIQGYRRAVACDGRFAPAWKNLAYALGEQGRAREAIDAYRRAEALVPDDPAVLNNLAWLLATAPHPGDRDPAEAVRLAERACELTRYADASYRNTLSVARSAAGIAAGSIGR